MQVWKTMTGLVCVLLAALPSAAQEEATIAYSEARTGSLTSDDTAGHQYSFTGTSGDVLTITVSVIEGEMQPRLVLNSPAGEELAASTTDTLQPDARQARLFTRLTQSGSFSLDVLSANQSEGAYVLYLEGHPEAIDAALEPGVTRVDLSQPGRHVYIFEGQETAETRLTVQSSTPGASYLLELRDQTGRLFAIFDGAPSESFTLTLPASPRTYDVTVIAGAESSGTLLIRLEGGPTNAANAAPELSVEVPSDTCVLVSSTGTGVNIRNGPTTEGGVFSALRPDAFIEATGVSVDGEWYSVQIGEQLGWLSGEVVRSSGPCEDLPVVRVNTRPGSATPVPEATEPAPEATAEGI